MVFVNELTLSRNLEYDVTIGHCDGYIVYEKHAYSSGACQNCAISRTGASSCEATISADAGLSLSQGSRGIRAFLDACSEAGSFYIRGAVISLFGLAKVITSNR